MSYHAGGVGGFGTGEGFGDGYCLAGYHRDLSGEGDGREIGDRGI